MNYYLVPGLLAHRVVAGQFSTHYHRISSALLLDLDQDLGLIPDLGQDEGAFLQSRINRFQVCCSLLHFQPSNLDCRSTAILHTQTLHNRLAHKQSLNAYDEAG